MKKIKIGNKLIGERESCFIIAEIGLNHNGKLKLAEKLIIEAKRAGADAVKFQVYRTEKLIRKGDKNFNLFKLLELKDKEWRELSKFAKKLGIVFFPSVFDEESVDFLDKLGVPLYKIASGDLTYLSLIGYVASKKKPVILSTGGGVIREIDDAIKTIYSTGNKDVILLHCVSSYPTEYRDMNLRAIKMMRERFRVPVGLSDHSIGTLIPTVAATLGADVIEKHFTLNRNLPGPDQKLSLTPSEFKEMVENIKRAKSSLGSEIKQILKSEIKIMNIARRSIVANKAIPKGTTITRDMIKIVRPSGGIEAKFINKILGKVTKKNIQDDEIITRNKIK